MSKAIDAAGVHAPPHATPSYRPDAAPSPSASERAVTIERAPHADAPRPRPSAPDCGVDTVFAPPAPAATRRGERARHHHRLYVDLARSLDAAVAVLSVLTAFLLVNSSSMSLGVGDFLAERVRLKNVLLLAAFVVCWQHVFALFGLYDKRRNVAPRDEAAAIVAACTVGSLLTLAFPLVSTQHSFGALASAYVWVAAVLGTLAGRRLLRLAVTTRRPETRRAIIVGSGPRARDVFRQTQSHSESRYEVVGFADSNDQCPFPEIRERTLGRLEELEQILMHTVVDEVLIALPVKSRYAEIQEVIEVCERAGVESKYPADMFRCALARPHFDSTGVPMVTLRVVESGAALALKRAIDVVGALAGLLVLSPLLLAAAVAVRASGPGPVIFSQERYGLRKRRFRMYKFRTMVCNAEQLQTGLESRNEAAGPVFKIRRDPRVTRVGRLLRRTSIDELPQLFNVLRGDMSIVGPRPLPIRDVQRFTEPWLMRRFSVRPGLTCLWQVGGRSETTFDQWIALDLEYIDRWSLWLDLKILARTVPAVLRGTGAA